MITGFRDDGFPSNPVWGRDDYEEPGEEQDGASDDAQLTERVEEIVADQLVRMDEVFRRLADAEPSRPQDAQSLDSQLLASPEVCDEERECVDCHRPATAGKWCGYCFKVNKL